MLEGHKAYRVMIAAGLSRAGDSEKVPKRHTSISILLITEILFLYLDKENFKYAHQFLL